MFLLPDSSIIHIGLPILQLTPSDAKAVPTEDTSDEDPGLYEASMADVTPSSPLSRRKSRPTKLLSANRVAVTSRVPKEPLEGVNVSLNERHPVAEEDFELSVEDFFPDSGNYSSFNRLTIFISEGWPYVCRNRFKNRLGLVGRNP